MKLNLDVGEVGNQERTSAQPVSFIARSLTSGGIRNELSRRRPRLALSMMFMVGI
jgi:hypothetical protein